jgi:hypothetical protein
MSTPNPFTQKEEEHKYITRKIGGNIIKHVMGISKKHTCGLKEQNRSRRSLQYESKAPILSKEYKKLILKPNPTARKRNNKKGF